MVDLRNQLMSNSYTSNQQTDYTVQNMQSQINTLHEQLRNKDYEIASLVSFNFDLWKNEKARFNCGKILHSFLFNFLVLDLMEYASF